jgi:hypothetical protein
VWNTYSVTNANSNRNSYSYCDSHGHGNTDSYSYSDANTNSERHTYATAYPNTTDQSGTASPSDSPAEALMYSRKEYHNLSPGRLVFE